MASQSIPIDPKAPQMDRFKSIIRRATTARAIFKQSFDAFYPSEARAPGVSLPDED